jgi:hypothetical protein
VPLILLLSIAIHARYIGSKVVVSRLALELGASHLLAIASLFNGIGSGVGQPLSMTLSYNRSPAGRTGEVGCRVKKRLSQTVRWWP